MNERDKVADKPNERPKDNRAHPTKSGLKEEVLVQGPKPEGVSLPEGDIVEESEESELASED